MSDYDNTNSGALFKNDKGDNEKRPDYKGNINVDGQEFYISAWLREAKSGKKFMSLKVEPKDKDAAPKTGGKPEFKSECDDQDIPF